MTLEELQGFAAARGCRCMGNVLVGVHRGFPFATVLKQGRVSSLTTTIQLKKGVPGRDLKLWKRELPHGTALTQAGGIITMICSGTDSLLDQYSQAMNVLTGHLREAGAVVPDQCPLCRKPGCDGVALVGRYVPVHQACCREHSVSTVTRAEVNARTGSYVTGLIGALAGGFVGAIPTILGIYFLEMIWSLLFALIPLGAYYGYKLCRGRMNRFALAAVLISCLFQLFAMEQALFYIVLHDLTGLFPSMFATIGLYFDLMTPGDMFADMWQSVLFMALGVWIVFRRISQTSVSEVHSAGTLMDSMMPYSGSGQVLQGPEL